jgi:hypothetical protein
MHRISAIIDETNPMSSSVATGVASGPQSTLRPNAYTQLIQHLFRGPTAVAIIGVGSGEGFTAICEEIALELSGTGRRVVLVSVQALLNSSSFALPDKTVFAPGSARNVWLWPPHFGQKMECFKSRVPEAPENWLDSLRANFDAVILRCPTLESAPGGAAIAAMADAAVLAVESRSTKEQILRDQRALQLSGVKLAGCILIDAR